MLKSLGMLSLSNYKLILNFAGIAQLVERNLAKVEVAGLSPVSRSLMAKWQSGHAAACKAVNAGSIPTLALITKIIYILN